MCGLICVVGHEMSSQSLIDAVSSLRHRGPDGYGSRADDDQKVGLAHARLAIIDLATGGQPIGTSDGDLFIVCNGEFYDHEAIRGRLQARGHVFSTASDSEIALHLYREHGTEFIHHLRGEFALVLHDRRRGRVLIARDRFGIKPLFMARTPQGGIVVASEIKALFATKLVSPRIEPAGLARQLAGVLGGVRQVAEQPDLAFSGVGIIEPGELIDIDVASLEVTRSRYWTPDLPRQNSSTIPAANAADVQSALEEAVRLRLRADVPVGAYLSGGVDSAVVCALASRHLDAPLQVFCISYPEGEDEASAARRVAEHIGARHHELRVSTDMLWQNFEECLWHVEAPVRDLSPVGKFLLSRMAHDHVRVVLTGEGADEVFLGYREFIDVAERSPARSAPGWLAGVLPLIFSAPHRDAVREALRSGLRGDERAHPLTEKETEGRDAVHRLQYERISMMPLGVLSALGDRPEMAHAIEARTPFLDHHLFGGAKTIPPERNLARGVGKELLREVAENFLPRDVAWAPKMGFAVSTPAVTMVGGRSKQLDALMRRYLSREAFEEVGIFDYRWYRAARWLLGGQAVKRWRTARFMARVLEFLEFCIMQIHMLHALFVRGEGAKFARR